MIKRLIGVIIVAGLLVALLVYSQRRTTPLKVSGFIEAHEIRLGSRVGGRVMAVHVEEGDAVTAEQVLLELHPFDLIERQHEAEAQLASAQAEHDQLVAGFRVEEIAEAQARRDRVAANLEKLVAGPRPEDIAVAQAELEQAEAELDRAATRDARVQAAAELRAARPEETDEATRALKVAGATLNARQAALDKLLAGTRQEEIAGAEAQLAEAQQGLLLMQRGNRREVIEQASAAVEAARQRVAAIGKQIAELSIRAPVDGIVETMDLQVGDLVAVNAPVLSMMHHDELWVRAYVPEDELGLTLGRRVAVTVDSYPGETFTGRIAFIARQAEFTPSNVQTPEERSQQVFRIKVVLEEGRDRLRPGMAADVWLDPEPTGS